MDFVFDLIPEIERLLNCIAGGIIFNEFNILETVIFIVSTKINVHKYYWNTVQY